MQRIVLLCVVFLGCSYQIQGSKVTPVFVQTGHDLNLDVPEADVPETFIVFVWRFRTDDGIVSFLPDGKPHVKKAYTGRVEASVKKYSVTLKNVQKADSGLYTAKVMTTGEDDPDLLQYDVTVQDPVSPVYLKVDSSSSSSSSSSTSFFSSFSCNFTLTCSTNNSQISRTFRCDSKTCHQDGGQRPEASLQVYLSDDLITCNHSNHVSWKKDERSAESICSRADGSRTHIWVVVVVIFGVIVIITLIIAFLRWRRRKSNNGVCVDNTVYDVAVVSNHQTKNESRSYEEEQNPVTTYSMVGPSTRGESQPESVYAVVQKQSG